MEPASPRRIISAPVVVAGAPTHVDRLDAGPRGGPDRLVIAVANGCVVAQRLAQRPEVQHGAALRLSRFVLHIEAEPPLLAADAEPIRAARSCGRREGVLLQQVVDGDAALVLKIGAPAKSRARVQHDIEQPGLAGRIPVHALTPTRRRALAPPRARGHEGPRLRRASRPPGRFAQGWRRRSRRRSCA